MMKRIRTTLVALLIAFAIAFSAGPLDGFFRVSSAQSLDVAIPKPPGGAPLANSAQQVAGVKPPKG